MATTTAARLCMCILTCPSEQEAMATATTTTMVAESMAMAGHTIGRMVWAITTNTALAATTTDTVANCARAREGARAIRLARRGNQLTVHSLNTARNKTQ